MPRYLCTIYYQTPGGQPGVFNDEVLAKDECVATERAERVCRSTRSVAKIDGGTVYAMRSGKTVRPRDLKKSSAKRRVIVIIPDTGSMEANDLYDFLFNEMNNAKIKARIYTTDTPIAATDMIQRFAARPDVISTPVKE